MSLLDAFLLEGSKLNAWVAIRVDGLAGSGTLDDPYNGSTPDTFDKGMNLLASQVTATTGVCVHLGPGVFQTRGYFEGTNEGWQPSARFKIVGSGLEVTTLQLVSSAPNDQACFAVGHAPGVSATRVDFFEISDLTIDCNLAGQTNDVAAGAIRIQGHHTRIRRVRVKSWGTRSADAECYVVAVLTPVLPTGAITLFDAVIDGCVVDAPAGENLGPCTMLHVGGPGGEAVQPEVLGESAVIRNCFVDGGQHTFGTGTPELRALSVSGCRGAIVENNQISNVLVGGPFHSKASVQEAIVRDNWYQNVVHGVFFDLGGLGPAASVILTCASGQAVGTMAAGHGLANGDRVKIAGTPGTVVEFFQVEVVSATVFQYATASFAGSHSATFQKVLGLNKLLVEGNTIELAPLNAEDVLVPVAVHLRDAPSDLTGPPFPHGQIIVRNNRLRYVEGHAGSHTGYALQINGANAVIISGNWIETVPPGVEPIQTLRCGNVTFVDNRTFAGRLLPRLDPETEKYLEEWDAPAEDALAAACFAG